MVPLPGTRLVVAIFLGIDPLEDGVRCQRCTCVRCGHYLGDGLCSFCNSEAGNSFVNDSIPNSFTDLPNFFAYLHNLELRRLEQVANLSTYPSQHFKSFCYDYDDDYDYEESTISLNEIISQIPSSIAITPVLPTLEPEDSLILEDEHLRTIPEKESDEFIKSSVEDLVHSQDDVEDRIWV
ncbi:hypothetical protein Tco_0788259 [Tanacetum coccineum]